MSPFLEAEAGCCNGNTAIDLKKSYESQTLKPDGSMNGFKLPPPEAEQIHDLLCIGFGPASLAIAIALNDALDPSGNIAGTRPEVCFLERQTEFAWHAGMLLPDAKMQISFIKDLATLRDPRSEFTFLNYLKRHNRLVQFSNLGTFLPSRAEFQHYLRWCADHFQQSVRYGQEALEIQPVRTGKDSPVDAFTVLSRNVRDGSVSRATARNIVIATGGMPQIPSIMPRNHPRIIHSSQYCREVPSLLSDTNKAHRIAVVGGGQSAAEIFQDLNRRYPNAKTYLVIRDTALRPSDDSPFVNEVFNPDRVDHFYKGSNGARGDAIKADKSTNYSVVRLALLEQIYHDLYQQSLHQPNDRQAQHQLLTSREIVRVTTTNSQDEDDITNLTLTIKNINPLKPRLSTPNMQPNKHHQNSTKSYNNDQQDEDKEGEEEEETLPLDAIVLGTGYTRTTHHSLLKPLQHLRPDTPTTTTTDNTNNINPPWPIRRNYKLILNESQVDTANAGIWLQGCNESTHGLADTLLSNLATRGGEIVQSIFAADRRGDRAAGGEAK